MCNSADAHRLLDETLHLLIDDIFIDNFNLMCLIPSFCVLCWWFCTLTTGYSSSMGDHSNIQMTEKRLVIKLLWRRSEIILWNWFLFIDIINGIGVSLLLNGFQHFPPLQMNESVWFVWIYAVELLYCCLSLWSILCAEDWQVIRLFFHSTKVRTTDFLIEATCFNSNSWDIENTI